MLPMSATSQFQNVAPIVNSSYYHPGSFDHPQVGSGLPAPEIPPPAGWDTVTNALLQAFQTAQAQRQLQDQAQQAQLTLLANALAADLQNTHSHLSYPTLTPSQLGALHSAVANLNYAPNVPSTIYAPRWVPGTVQQQQQHLVARLLQQRLHQQQQQNSNFNDGTNFSPSAEPNDGYDNEQNNAE